MVYLLDNTPVRAQFRPGRRAIPSGLTVIHTAESVMDIVSPDTGAESVARFIQGRSEPGSYHDLVDSDSDIHLVRYDDEAYQDGTGSNSFALSISFACRTDDWDRMPAIRRTRFLAQGAAAFARQQAWLRSKGYPTTPLRRISKAQADARMAGFISHAERDPDRRSDPGLRFPWTEFFAACSVAQGTSPVPPIPEEDDMPTADEVASAVWKYAAGISPGDNKTPINTHYALRVASNYAYRAYLENLAQRGQIAALVGAVGALATGEDFDEAKLLDSIEDRVRTATAAAIVDAGRAIEAVTPT